MGIQSRVIAHNFTMKLRDRLLINKPNRLEYNKPIKRLRRRKKVPGQDLVFRKLKTFFAKYDLIDFDSFLLDEFGAHYLHMFKSEAPVIYSLVKELNFLDRLIVDGFIKLFLFAFEKMMLLKKKSPVFPEIRWLRRVSCYTKLRGSYLWEVEFAYSFLPCSCVRRMLFLVLNRIQALNHDVIGKIISYIK